MLATKITSSLASLLKIYGMWRTQRAYSGVGCLLENLLQLGQYHGWLLGFMGLEAPFLVYFFLMCLTWNSQWFWARSVCFHLLLVHTRYVLRRQTYGLKDKCTYKKPSMKDAVCSSYELVPALWVSRKYQRAKWLSSGRSIWRCVIFLRRIKPVSIHLSHSTNEEMGDWGLVCEPETLSGLLREARSGKAASPPQTLHSFTSPYPAIVCCFYNHGHWQGPCKSCNFSLSVLSLRILLPPSRKGGVGMGSLVIEGDE